MQPLDVLAAMPQFITTDDSRTVYNVLSNCFLSERQEKPGLILKSGSEVATLEGPALDKYLKVADLQAALLSVGNR